MQAPYSSPNSTPDAPINSPVVSSLEHAPMPLRARGVLEQLDLAIKVYRRYFGALTSWSALVLSACTIIGLMMILTTGRTLINAASLPNASPTSLIAPFLSLTSVFFVAGLVGFFGFPMVVGAVSCVTTAAVRGQRIEFEQCWDFTKTRYGGMLLQTFLGVLLFMLIVFGASIAFGLMVALGAGIVGVAAQNSSAIVVIGVIIAIALYITFLVLMMALSLWFYMVPIIACMEDNRRRSGAIARSSALMRGGWWRGAGLMLLTAIGMWIIILLTQIITGLLLGSFSPNALSAGSLALSFLANMVVYTLTLPFFLLIAALFYIDQRVRNEALDLEWASYSGAEGSTVNAGTNNYTTPGEGSSAAQNATGFSQPDEAIFTASPEDIASMPLDAFAIKKPLGANNVAQPQAGADALGRPQNSPANIAPANSFTPTSHGTQILAPEPTFSPTPFSDSDDAQSSTRSDASAQNGDTATKTCASCGAQVPVAQNFCLTCGARLSIQ